MNRQPTKQAAVALLQQSFDTVRIRPFYGFDQSVDGRSIAAEKDEQMNVLRHVNKCVKAVVVTH